MAAPVSRWTLTIIARERSYAPIDVPQIFSGSAAYELPFGPGKPGFRTAGRGQDHRRMAVERDRDSARRFPDRHPHQRSCRRSSTPSMLRTGFPGSRWCCATRASTATSIPRRSRFRAPSEHHRRADSAVRQRGAARRPRSGVEERRRLGLQEHQTSANGRCCSSVRSSSTSPIRRRSSCPRPTARR